MELDLAKELPAPWGTKLSIGQWLWFVSGVVGYASIQLGAVGVEKTYASDLEGRNFDLQLHNLADAFANKQPVGTVVLTMSKAAQGTAAFALQGKRGSVVVLDVATGGVLAAYSNPTFDPNQLASHDAKKAQAAYSVLTRAPDKPLLSRAWRELYPHSEPERITPLRVSARKTTVYRLEGAGPAGAAIIAKRTRTAGALTDHLVLPQTNGVSLFNFGRERCGGSLLSGFIVSCNTTYAQVGFDLGEKFASGIQGFGVQTAAPREDRSGIDPPIVASTGPVPGSFQQNQPKFMQDAIGQNQVLVPPLEMALVAEAIANQGVILQPHVVDCVLDPNDKVNSRVGVQQYKRAIDPATAKIAQVSPVSADYEVQQAIRGFSPPPASWGTPAPNNAPPTSGPGIVMVIEGIADVFERGLDRKLD